MNITTSYLGLRLNSPVILAASPISRDIEAVKKAADLGAGAVVSYSLFEEQIQQESRSLDHFLTTSAEGSAEALSYFPEPSAYFNVDAEDYIRQLGKLKKSVSIPVIGSLNGVSQGGWMRYAKKMEDEGVDAIELNIFYVPTDPRITNEDIEKIYLDSLQAVKTAVKIPVSIKLSPFFTCLANFAKRLDNAGVDGLVLFNRFFCPDIDLEAKEVVPALELSERTELGLPLRWIAILNGQVKADLAATSGIHKPVDIVKAIMAGANVTMVASSILKNGVEYVGTLVGGLKNWLEENEYSSVAEMRGSMSYKNVAHPAAYERANYMKALQSYGVK